MRWLDAGLVPLFSWAAILQLNDPDPVRWFAVYGAGAAVAACAFLLASGGAWCRALALLAAALTLVCLVWGSVISISLLGTGWTPLAGLGDLGGRMTPDRPEVEWARESLGLLIVGVWSGGIAWRMHRVATSSPGAA